MRIYRHIPEFTLRTIRIDEKTIDFIIERFLRKHRFKSNRPLLLNIGWHDHCRSCIIDLYLKKIISLFNFCKCLWNHN